VLIEGGQKMSEMKFEEALKRLERIVEDLEKGTLSLDESLKKYEEGVRLSQICSKRLDAAQKRVEILAKKEGGKFELRPFEEETAEEREE
jgi:exodeoxyribonuclease VII small subunit